MLVSEDNASEHIENGEARSPFQDSMSMIDCWTACSTNNIELTKEQMFTLERFANEMHYWNQSVNMISRKDENNIWERHILHSLSLLKYVEFPAKCRVLDIGTGGGFPGTPLKIARPDLKVTMVDSIGKKAKIASMLAQHTMLKDIEVLNTRVEELANKKNYVGSFAVIVSRAVSSISNLLEWSKPLLASNGQFAFLKGGDLTEEIDEAKQRFKGLRIEVQDIQMFAVPWFQKEEKKVIKCRFD